MTGPLYELVSLPEKERKEKGIEYSPREIWSQPKIWLKNFEILSRKKEEIRSFVESRILNKDNSQVVLSGAGSSAFIGTSAELLLRKRWQKPVEARPNTDIMTNWDSIFLKHAETTLISFSRSGNSPEAVGAFMLADKFCGKISHIIVTCNRDGQLAKLGEGREDVLLLVLSEETNDRGLAMTASFTTMLMTAQLLGYILSMEDYGRIVQDLSKAAESVLKESSALLKEISELDFHRSFFLGTGPLYGCALESHLKLQELTAGQIICKADSFLGIRHGPKAAVNDETLIVYYVSDNPFVQRYELDLMADMHARDLGMRKIAVCKKRNKEITDYVDHVIELDPDDVLSVPDYCRPIVDVTIGQTLGLFKSLSLGLKPDNPSEKGVITRVVEGVKIYDDEKFKKQKRFVIVAG